MRGVMVILLALMLTGGVGRHRYGSLRMRPEQAFRGSPPNCAA